MFLLVLFFSAVDIALALAVETHSSRPDFEPHSHLGQMMMISSCEELALTSRAKSCRHPSIDPRSHRLKSSCNVMRDLVSPFLQEALDGFDTETDLDPLQGLNVIERLSFSRIFDDYNRLMDANEKILQEDIVVLEKNRLAFEALLADIESFESTRLA
jgi:hypothetical protein